MKKLTLNLILIIPTMLLAEVSRCQTVQVKGYFPTHKDFPSNSFSQQHSTVWERSRLDLRASYEEDSNRIKNKNVNTKRARARVSMSAENKYRKQKYLKMINRVRSQRQYCGRYGSFGPAAPLRWSEKLYKSAKGHSVDMATHNNFSHEGTGTETDVAGSYRGVRSTPSIRALHYRYRGGIVGENIALGYGQENSSIEAAIRSWLSSDSHCANLMSPRYKRVGMSRVKNKKPGQDSRYYWSQEFGT
jgi:uncharacterized protein YkwD